MFKSKHDELLEIAMFRPSGEHNNLQVVEMWKYQGAESCTDRNFRHIMITDDHVSDWLAQKGRFAPLPPQNSRAVLEGGIRMIMCDRNVYRPPGFAMSKESFLAIERELSLPPNTLESVFNHQGAFSKRFVYSDHETDKLESVGFTIKVPQKMPIANYVLACSHNLSNRITTAFIHGSFLHVALPTMRLSLQCSPLLYSTTARHNDYINFQENMIPTEITQSSQFIIRLRGAISQWANPVLLPVLIVENYATRSDLFTWDLDDQVVTLERQTGVVFAARTVHSHERAIRPERLPRQTIHNLTQDMHTLLTEIINFERSAEWLVDCSAFLGNIACEIGKMTARDNGGGQSRMNREMGEFIEFITSGAVSRSGHQRTLKERVQSQINVLYSFIAQIDNSINARIAISSARDSSAMKTLALVTVLFLPPTYVATLFSMSFFSWSENSGTISEETVSNKFWIYWAVTVPLTILVITLWRLWWVWQEKSYQREVDRAVGTGNEDDETGVDVSGSFEKTPGR